MNHIERSKHSLMVHGYFYWRSLTCLCRGDDSDAESSDEDDDPKKPIPEWARGRALMQQLANQVQTDPDEVFQQHRKTCSLDEGFGHAGEQLAHI